MSFSPTLCFCVDKNHHLLCGESHIWGGVSVYLSGTMPLVRMWGSVSTTLLPPRGPSYSLCFKGHPNLKFLRKPQRNKKSSLVFSNIPYESWSCLLPRTHRSLQLDVTEKHNKSLLLAREMAPFILMWCFPHQGHCHLRGFTNPDGPSGE